MAKKAGVSYSDINKTVSYVKALEAAGVEAVLITPGKAGQFEGLDGLLLTGGTDVSPARYGEAPVPECHEPDLVRDELEIKLVKEALEKGLPVFGICRGIQLLNVAMGGTLVQHLGTSERHKSLAPDKALVVHEVTVEEGTKLYKIVGTGKIGVNSRHHQAVEKVGKGLVVSARSTEDDVIEAVEMPDKEFVLAVQWHPENQVNILDSARELFSAFAKAL
ncbi:MAG: gamma-glutamyl-gamma-aminobutyrate hydrolase family protein [Firmicutes bacterium]|nr:gamma-glutamyl-gamma-aminobutyrate hydrolase family protein [Bacillota bacterium]